MKRILLLFLILGVTVNLYAQQENFIRKPLPPTLHHPAAPSSVTLNRANMVSDWYNYSNTLYEILGDITSYRFLIFPDSTVLISDGISMVSPMIHSVGQVFDPTDPNFDAVNTALSRYIPYTLDSIAFGYRYWRFQDNAPDTLIVQIYTDNKIISEPDPGWTSGASFATVEYDYTKNLGKFSAITDTILLTNADTISTDIALFALPVNLSVAAGKKVAVTVTYFPGNPYAAGDTLDAEINAVNKINALEMYDYGTDYMIPHYYNNELDAETSVRYNMNTNGWNGYYFPGTAFSDDEFFHFDISWRITYDQSILGLRTAKVAAGVTTFPNPSAGLFTVAINSATPEKGFISVSNLLGEEVLSKTIDLKSGRNLLDFKLPENCPVGLYHLSIKTNTSRINTTIVYQP